MLRKAIGIKNTIGTAINNATPATPADLSVDHRSKEDWRLSDPDSRANSVFSAKRSVDSAELEAFGTKNTNGLSSAEQEALRKAVREASKLGAKIVGATFEIEGDLPDELLAALPADQLYEYFGAAAEDRAAIEFLAGLNVSPILVTDPAGAAAAMRDLGDGTDIIGLDFETGPPDARPEPVRIDPSSYYELYPWRVHQRLVQRSERAGVTVTRLPPWRHQRQCHRPTATTWSP